MFSRDMEGPIYNEHTLHAVICHVSSNAVFKDSTPHHLHSFFRTQLELSIFVFSLNWPILLWIYPIKSPDHPLVKFLLKPFLLRLCPLMCNKKRKRDRVYFQVHIKLVTHFKASSTSPVLLNILSSASVLFRGLIILPEKIVLEL